MSRRREPNANAACLAPLLKAVGFMVHAETKEQAKTWLLKVAREWRKLEALEG